MFGPRAVRNFEPCVWAVIRSWLGAAKKIRFGPGVQEVVPTLQVRGSVRWAHHSFSLSVPLLPGQQLRRPVAERRIHPDEDLLRVQNTHADGIPGRVSQRSFVHSRNTMAPLIFLGLEGAVPQGADDLPHVTLGVLPQDANGHTYAPDKRFGHGDFINALAVGMGFLHDRVHECTEVHRTTLVVERFHPLIRTPRPNFPTPLNAPTSPANEPPGASTLRKVETCFRAGGCPEF